MSKKAGIFKLNHFSPIWLAIFDASQIPGVPEDIIEQIAIRISDGTDAVSPMG